MLDHYAKYLVYLIRNWNISFISEQTASASEEFTASSEEITAIMEELTRHSSELQILAEQLGNEINKFKTKELSTN